MKRLLSIVYLSVVVMASAYCTETIRFSSSSSETGVVPGEECKFRRNYGTTSIVFSLFGKVRIVPKDGDLRVYVAKPGDCCEDLIVKWVPEESIVCGEWMRVDSGERFTVSFTDDFWDADIVIRYGEPRDYYGYCCGPTWRDHY